MTPTRATLAAEREWVEATESHRKADGEPCPKCGGLSVELTGFTGTGLLVYTCAECGHKVTR